MIDRQVFEEMMAIYGEAIPEMGLLGEIDWRNAAKTTLIRLNSYLRTELIESSPQLARECHADLQGYVKVKFDVDLMNSQDCQSEDCFKLYLLGQRLVEIGGLP